MESSLALDRIELAKIGDRLKQLNCA